MKRIVLIFAALMTAMAGYAQGEDWIALTKFYDRLNRDIYFSGENAVRYENIEGTPYLTDEFRKGLLYLKSGEVFSGDYRLDLYANQIEFRKEDGIYVIGTRDSIAKLDFEDNTIMYVRYEEDITTKQAFFILIEGGYYSAFIQKNILFRNATPARPYQDAPLPARFEQGTDLFYLAEKDNIAVKIGSKKEAITFFGDHGDIAKQFIDKEKINVKKPFDLARLIRHMNGVAEK
jgi:hypothetical protein